jgi:hypothetical protein
MFEHSRQLLEQYYCTLIRKGVSKRGEHLMHELRSRLRMLEWLQAQLFALDKQLEMESRAEIPPDSAQPEVMKLLFTDSGRPDCATYRHAQTPFSPSDELRTLLEAFYYNAHRVGDILRDSSGDLPGPSRFDPVGVRNVRNHLIEHPNRKNAYSFRASQLVVPLVRNSSQFAGLWMRLLPMTLDCGITQQSSSPRLRLGLNTQLILQRTNNRGEAGAARNSSGNRSMRGGAQLSLMR